MTNDLIKIGIKKGDMLNIKVSLSSIGYVEGGAVAVIDALLDVVGSRGTLVAESFIGGGYSDRYSPSYAGAVANAMITYPGSYRSTHPIQRFTAVGYRAKELMANHTPKSYAYDVLRVMSETGGKNLRIGDKVVGVGTTHVAIGLLGLKQDFPKNSVIYSGGVFVRDWAGGCAEGFNNFMHLYKKREGLIGKANSMLTDMGETLQIEMTVLRRDPTYFMCGKCIDCKYSWEFSTGRFKKIMLPLLRTYNRLK